MFLLIIFLIILIGFLFSYIQYKKIKTIVNKDKNINEISNLIYKGSISFLKTEFKIILIFVILITVILFLFNFKLAISFLFGAIISSLASFIILTTSTKSNAKAITSCKKSLKEGFYTAFSSGLSSSIFLISLGILGIITIFVLFKDVNILFGFGFGASLIALFLRVGGGIFTKAADIGADLVGKIEKGIPENDSRNPAVIADNVGDNVGDVVGMGTDILESYVQSIVASMVLGFLAFQEIGLMLPLLISSIGLIASILGSFFIKTKNNNFYFAINKGLYVSVFIILIFSLFFVLNLFNSLDLFWSILVGIISAIFISKYIFYVTSSKNSPTQNIAKSSQTGAATNILKGFSVGMFSTAFPIIIIGISIIISYHFGSYFGISLSAVSLFCVLGLILAADFFGPIVDNAQGIVEMTNGDKKLQEKTETLDQLGNSTAAITKGFAIASAAFTSIALFITYIVVTNISTIDLINIPVIVSLFIGGMLPFVFASYLLFAVEKASFKIIIEIRRQFETIKGIMQRKAKPDYNKCIKISTIESMKGMIIPALIAIFSPLIIALLFGFEAVGGFLAGCIASGFVLALFMANSGGAWDNAKKYIEEGNFGGKASFAHKASVVGDTVGDPFKDTCGPSINILIKLMTIVSLIFIPLVL